MNNFQSDYLISVKGLHKYYQDVHVLRGIDFNVRKGELISIIGRSGCGKTTLLRCLNCLEILDAGTLHVAGITLSRKNSNERIDADFEKRAKTHRKNVGMPFHGFENQPLLDEDFQIKVHALRARVGMLFQGLNLFPHLTVLENVALAPVIVKKDNKDDAIANAKRMLEKVGLKDFINRYPHQISGGQAQRVAIARALAMNPQVMMYDEPTSALDPELVKEVLQVMINLHDEGMTQIIVTHALNFVRNSSDFIVYMENGEIIETASPAELFENPRDERTKQYLKVFEE